MNSALPVLRQRLLSPTVRTSPCAAVVAIVCGVVAATAMLYPVQWFDPGMSGGVLYVLAVLAVSVTWGLWPGIATAVVSTLALWYFHAAPGRGFGGISSRDLAAMVVLLFTEFVAALIADRARSQLAQAGLRAELELERIGHETERRRLDELEASRARVIAASDEERGRVVRDLHDGAQQRLVHTVIGLKLVERALLAGDLAAGTELARQALRDAQGAVGELRDLAHGILPSALARGGLADGVDTLAARMPIPTAVAVSAERFATAVESTAYFVVAEALTNVIKHAGATRVDVSTAFDGEVLVVTVEDDGCGGARGDGHGLVGLRDRVASLGGDLRVTDRAAGGTSLVAAIPAAASPAAPAAASAPAPAPG